MVARARAHRRPGQLGDAELRSWELGSCGAESWGAQELGAGSWGAAELGSYVKDIKGVRAEPSSAQSSPESAATV